MPVGAVVGPGDDEEDVVIGSLFGSRAPIAQEAVSDDKIRSGRNDVFPIRYSNGPTRFPVWLFVFRHAVAVPVSAASSLTERASLKRRGRGTVRSR